ncbi:LEM domain-containing protein 1 isoform X1 [Hyaena hyaena]|uniref:LEM domain-containing protein 1 isoform X1 n=1 Tax=Hyaena hyaena TaxID=95912 RepID=UPI0019217CEB|nr:LEM domain-containing protein 1 isoform X1 [Hyaena hyaena]
MVDVKCLSDYELQNELNKLGFSPGPILPSTRKVYEKKLIQLLVSPPCASPMMNGPRELARDQDDDGKEHKATIILKGNIIISSEKNKGPKKRLAFATKSKAIDIYCLAYKHPEGIRLTRRASSTTFKEWRSTRGTDYCIVDDSVESGNLESFPVTLKLAMFGIFIIVIFVYITVERKPFFG